MLITAKRRGYHTEVKWLQERDNVITNVIFDDGTKKTVTTQEELEHLYTPYTKGLLSSYKFNSRRTIEEPVVSKKESNPMPTGVVRPTPPPSPPTQVDRTNENIPDDNKLGSEKFTKQIETLYVLQMYRDDELIYEMEFEDFDDLLYRKNKLIEKYPNVSMYIKTLRSVVSYVKL